MASVSVDCARDSGAGAALFACIAEHGSAAHPYFSHELPTAGSESIRMLADAVHFLCALHGRHPGIVDLAADRTVDVPARTWLNSASGAMAAERQYLTRLAVAAGPVPGTPGGATSEATVIAQRSALATLAQSDRRGCALGAALAFAADWIPIRALLDTAARRFGVEPPPRRLGREEDLREVADGAGESASTERALLFGAQQLALQHRGLWDLLEARNQARLGG
jgi:hypothetical protein